VQTAHHEVDVDEDDDLESELIWRAPPLLTLADIPWLIDDTVEPGVTLRYTISYLRLIQWTSGSVPDCGVRYPTMIYGIVDCTSLLQCLD